MTMKRLPAKHVYLMANGDLRLSANQKCWPVQAATGGAVDQALKALRLDRRSRPRL